MLPAPSLVNEITIIEATTAKFHPAKGHRPAGWEIVDVSTPPLADIERNLTEKGRQFVVVLPGNRLFVASAITCDQLFKRSSSFTSLSTVELLDRIRCPAFGQVSVHRLVLYLHSRFTQPLLNLIAVLLTIPLMVRRESPGLAADSSLCGFVLALLFGVTQGFQSLGSLVCLSPPIF